MADHLDLLEPVSLYNKQLKAEFHQHAEDIFDELVRKSNVNAEANKQTVKEYKNALNQLEIAKKKLSKTKGWKTFLIIMTILLFIVAGLFIYFAVAKKVMPVLGNIAVAVGAVLLAVLFIVLLADKIKKKIKAQKEQCDELTTLSNQKLAEAQAQMLGLNRLFDWNAHVEIVKRTSDILTIDPVFNMARFHYLHDNYGLEDEVDEHISTDMIMSGALVNNPFLLVRQVNQSMGTKAYYGTLTISWTETVHDSNGKSHTVTRTEVLHASVIKPIPVYEYKTFLVYANEAAPDLSFSRVPSGVTGMSEKQIQSRVKKGAKDLKKKAQSALEKGGKPITLLGNEEFDVLFGATDRDNEVQFRLLFTPLAQKSMLELIKTPEPYGDDFTFVKKGPLNFITSMHSQNQDYYGNPARYLSYDLEAAREAFVNYNDTLLKSLFFDLAPVLCIPLYQQMESPSFTPLSEYEQNFTSYESEVMANAFDPSVFKHPDSVTPVVLKSKFTGKCGKSDISTVTCHSFYSEERMDYVPVLGGDGKTHSVPVPWEEYLPLEYDSNMVVRAYEGSKDEFENLQSRDDFQQFVNRYVMNQFMIFQRGLIAFVSNENFDASAEEELTNLLKKDKM